MAIHLTSMAVVLCASVAGAQTLIGPLEYLSEADSPFRDRAGFLLEDFEDAEFNLAGVTPSAGSVLLPSSVTDSVDGDDGVIDGSGAQGHSFLSGNGPAGITFTFDTSAGAPIVAAAGVVWTDGSSPTGVITFEAYDRDGLLLGSLTGNHATSGFNGQTDEDRFYGVEYAQGIGSILIRNTPGGIEVDHLQIVVPVVCPGDLDGNLAVDSTDLNLLLADFGCTGGDCAGNIDGDGDTDSADLNIVLANFGTTCVTFPPR